MLLSTTQLHSLGHLIIFGHLMPSVLVSWSHDANSVISSTNACVRSNNQNEIQHAFFYSEGKTGMFYHVMPLVLLSYDVSGATMTTLHFIGQDNFNEVSHDSFRHVMPLTLVFASCVFNCIVNGTIAFYRSQDDQNEVKRTFWSCDAIDSSVKII